MILKEVKSEYFEGKLFYFLFEKWSTFGLFPNGPLDTRPHAERARRCLAFSLYPTIGCHVATLPATFHSWMIQFQIAIN